MIYGTPTIHVEYDQTDNIGIRTLVLSKMWEASRWPMEIEELDAESPAIPAVPGGLRLTATETRPARGMLRTAWTFEGIRGDGKTPLFAGRGVSLDYQFDPGFAQVEIALHPELQRMLDEGGGQVIDGEVYFPPTQAVTQPSFGSLSGSQKEKLNPYFGQKVFLRLEGVYTYRYVAQNLRGVNNGVGRIFSAASLPGEGPFYSDRDWLKAPVTWRRRGLIYEMLESYWLSGEGGWPRVIYGSGGASGSSRGRA